MEVKIDHKNGHYEMTVDGKFYGTYDTVTEAAKDIDSKAEKGEAEHAVA